MTTKTPGLGRWESSRLITQLQGDYIEMYRQVSEKFGYVSEVFLPFSRMIIFHPDHIRHVLKDNHKNYLKSPDYDELKPLLGRGLLTSEGEHWKRSRRRLSPEFTFESIRKQADGIVKRAEQLVLRLEERSRRTESFDLTHEMMLVTFQIVGDALFGSDFEKWAKDTARFFEMASEAATARMMTPLKLPLFFPTPVNLRYRKGIKILNGIIAQVIEERNKNPTSRTDLLSRLIALKNTEDSFTNKDLRDEMLTMILAGHETTSLALTWTWVELAKHPEVGEKLRAEAKAVLGGRSPTVDDLPRLKYAKQVFLESMRLHPPAAAISRKAIGQDSLGDVVVPAGQTVSCVIALTHRDPNYWDAPNEFRPERFSEEKEKKRVPFSFYPFGAGTRICIGEHFAMLEGQLILATMAQRLSFKLDPAHVIEQQPLVTLRLKHGAWGWITAQAPT